MSETNREDGPTGEDSFSDPTSGSSDWQPRTWEAPGAAPSDQSDSESGHPDATDPSDAAERPDSEQSDADLTQSVESDSTQQLPGDSGAPGRDAASDPSAGSVPPPPPLPYPMSDQGDHAGLGAPSYPSPGQAAPYGTSAYPPPPGTPGAGVPGPPPAPGAYGASPYGDPSSPYGAPPPAYYQQAPSQTNNSALVLTILSGIGIFACCGVTIVSLVLGIIGLTKQATDPVQSAKLTKWGWIAFAAGLVLAVLGFIAYVAGMIALAPEMTSDF